MALTKQQILKGYFHGQVSEEVFDLLLQRYPALFRVDSLGGFDERFLPVLSNTLLALISKTKREVAAVANEQQVTDAEKRRQEIAAEVVRLRRQDEKRLKKNVLTTLARELADGDAD